MEKSELMNKLLFDFSEFSEEKIIEMLNGLPTKLIRWLGTNHPDNRTRKIFFRLTNVSIGGGTVINQNFIVSDDYEPLLTIGNRVAISPNVTVICSSAPNNSNLNLNKYVNNNLVISKPVIICDDVWVGANSVILPGVTIGEGSIIGAGSVVVKDVPSNTIVAGVPAKPLKNLYHE